MSHRSRKGYDPRTKKPQVPEPDPAPEEPMVKAIKDDRVPWDKQNPANHQDLEALAEKLRKPQ